MSDTDLVKIEAIFQPHKLEEVKEALVEAGLDGMSAAEAHGIGRQQGRVEIYRGSEYDADLLPKIRLDLVVTRDRCDEAVRIITDAARTGRIGDGKVFVLPVESALRIRTGEVGERAIRSDS